MAERRMCALFGGKRKAAQPLCPRPRQRLEEPLPSDGMMKFTVMRQIKDSLEQYQVLRKDEKLCDVTLVTAEGIRYPCHKVILSAASPYFRAMFTRGMKECSNKTVTMPGITAEILGLIIDFIYSAEITITERNICQLMPAANMLDMPHIIEACTTYLEHQLEPCNCLGIGKFAQQYNCMDLKNRADRYVLAHFSDVRLSEEFLTLSFDELIKIISSDKLIVKCETEVFMACADWVSHDCDQRCCYMPCILKHVRLDHIPPEFIEQQLKYCEVLRRAPQQCTERLSKQFRELSMHCATTVDPPRMTCDRLVIYCIGGYVAQSVSNVEYFNPKTNEWKRIADVPHPRSGLAACTIKGYVYAVGGRNNCATSNTMDLGVVDCYDPRSNSWSTQPAMNTARSRVAVAVLDNRLYAIGGSSGTTAFNTVECYDPCTRLWTMVASMKYPRMAAGAAVVNRFLYVVGGFTGQERLQSVEKYYPERNEWQDCSPMHERRSGAGVCVLDQYIYVAGGYDAVNQLRSVERYDTRTNVWEMVAPMRQARSALSMVSLERRLFVLGGYGGSEFTASVECYIPEKNEWFEVSHMMSGRSGQGVTIGPAPSAP